MDKQQHKVEAGIMSAIIIITSIGLYTGYIDSIDFRWVIIACIAFFEGSSIAEILRGGM